MEKFDVFSLLGNGKREVLKLAKLGTCQRLIYLASSTHWIIMEEFEIPFSHVYGAEITRMWLQLTLLFCSRNKTFSLFLSRSCILKFSWRRTFLYAKNEESQIENRTLLRKSVFLHSFAWNLIFFCNRIWKLSSSCKLNQFEKSENHEFPMN